MYLGLRVYEKSNTLFFYYGYFKKPTLKEDFTERNKAFLEDTINNPSVFYQKLFLDSLSFINLRFYL